MSETTYYPPEFFSGCDITLKIKKGYGDKAKLNDMLNISYLQYDIGSNTTPLYNYNSAVAVGIWNGNRIVQGSFAVFIGSSYNIRKSLYGGFDNRDAYKMVDAMTSKKKDLLAPNQLTFTPADWKKLLLDTNSKSALEVFKDNNYYNNYVKLNKKENYSIVKSSLESNDEFEITITYGDSNMWYQYYDSEYRQDIIKGCKIMGFGSAIKHDEQALIDVYNFTAKDIISKTVKKKDSYNKKSNSNK